MSKWAGTLSTTEPYNHLGLLKVRQGNENSEIFEFNISENGLPYDLSGYRVFFCTHFDPYVSVEKNAEIIDAKKGIIRFVMDDDCMQKTGQQEGYFEIYKEDVFMGSTQNFTYTTQISIIKQLMDGESYIQRLEELLDKVREAMEKSQEEVNKWLEENRKEIDRLMEEMNQFFNEKQIEFNDWFEAVQDILKSIDPGGILLNEIVTARHSKHTKITYGSLSERLDAMEDSHYTIPYGFSSSEMTIQDDQFSKTHKVDFVESVISDNRLDGLVISRIDDPEIDTFYLVSEV